MVAHMKILHYITQWRHLKIKNTVLNEENRVLVTENEHLTLQNKAFQIENFEAGRRIAKLEIENKNLISAFYLQNANTVSKEDLLKLQEELTFNMKHGLRLTPKLLKEGVDIKK